MRRILPWCGLLAVVAALAAIPQASTAAPTTTESETLIRINADPAPDPKPALRYLLLPELKEQTPGNPIANYLKCMLEEDPKSINDEGFSRAALRHADLAARMDKPDWQILLKVKSDGISLLLPDLQKMRALAGALTNRFRNEIALRQIDAALVTAKTLFAMSRHMGVHPTLIGTLVGIAIAVVAINPLEELLEVPDCPNLYWALTNLPHPFISVESGMQGERILIHAELCERVGLKADMPMTAAQLKKVTSYIDILRPLADSKVDVKTQLWLNLRTKDEKYMAAARQRLTKYGIKPELVARFPADQVILLDEMWQYEILRDDEAKLMQLPTWEFVARANRKPDRAKYDKALFGFLVPAIYKVRLAQGRLEQRIALLRHVEALRMYAAEHDGQLPEKLTDVPVPLPADPFTGKPFRYKRDGAVGHLRGSPPKGEETIPAYNLHYEITIRK